LAGGASHLYGQLRGKLRPERGGADLAGFPVGPDGVGRCFGSAPIHQNGASEGGHRGNVMAVSPRHGRLASAGGSGCRRGSYDLASAEKPAATRMTTSLSQDTRYRVAGFGGTVRLRSRWETDFTTGRLRSTAARYWRTWLTRNASARKDERWSAEQVHGRRGHRVALGTSVRSTVRRRWTACRHVSPVVGVLRCSSGGYANRTA
jgi:hypothetical protein